MPRDALSPLQLAELALLRQGERAIPLHDVLGVPLQPTTEELAAAWIAFEKKWSPVQNAALEQGEVFLWLEDVYALGRRAVATLGHADARDAYELELARRGQAPATRREGTRRPPVDLAPATPGPGPNSPGGLAHQVRALRAEGQVEEARTRAAEALRAHPADRELVALFQALSVATHVSHADALAREAAEAEAQDDGRRALRLYREAVAAGTSVARAHVVLARSAQAEGRPATEVAGHLRRAHQLSPGDHEILLAYGEALVDAGMFALAQKVAREALQANGNDARARALLRRSCG